MWRCYLRLRRHLSQDCWLYNIHQREVSESLLFSDPKKVGAFLEGLKYKGHGCGQEGGEGKLIKGEMKAQEEHFWKTFTFLTSVPWPKWWMAEWVLNSWPIFAKPMKWETDVVWKRQKKNIRPGKMTSIYFTPIHFFTDKTRIWRMKPRKSP